MASREEKAEIAKQFILSAPCHEVQQVVKDVRILVADDELLDELLPSTLRAYNMENLVPVETPQGNMTILCPETCKDAADPNCHEFLDVVAGKYFTVSDHLKLVADEESGAGAGVADDSFQAAAQKELDRYLEAHYKSGSAVVVKSLAEEGVYTIVLNSEKSNKGSSWSGRWKSRLVLRAGAERTSGKADGDVHNAVHYYESGNVQMETTKHVSKEWVGLKDPETLARRFVVFLEDSEREFHMKLDEMCQHLSDKSLKTLRRRLPISKQPFNFQSGAHKLAMELTKGVNQ